MSLHKAADRTVGGATVTGMQRRGWRLTFEFDDAQPLECEREFMAAHGLAVGDCIEPAILDRLRLHALQDATERSAIRLLAVRPRSAADLHQRLRRSAFPPPIIEETIARLRAQGYLDDAAFAAQWTEERLRRHPRSARMIRAELQAHGVAAAAAAAAVAAVEDEAVAREIAERQAARFHGDWDGFQRKVGGLLLRRGYSEEVMRRTLRHVWGDRPSPPDA